MSVGTRLHAALVFGAVLAIAATAHARRCPSDSVQVGDVCVDRYEASVWSTTDAGTIKKIQKGRIGSAADLALATQHGNATDDYGTGCPDSGAGCMDYYAVSVPNVAPASNITWFQAMAACRNAGKHLATNEEWQAAALGTPDTGGMDNGMTDCNTDAASTSVLATGSRSGCVSDVGAFDMVGNVEEWVAEWVPFSTACPGWGGFTDDRMCFSGASTSATGPGALIRGGASATNTLAGPYNLVGDGHPVTGASADLGFRCARRL